MQRLHAGDHAKFSESRNVLGAGILNVFNLIPGIRAAVGFIGGLTLLKGPAFLPLFDPFGSSGKDKSVMTYFKLIPSTMSTVLQR